MGFQQAGKGDLHTLNSIRSHSIPERFASSFAPFREPDQATIGLDTRWDLAVDIVAVIVVIIGIYLAIKVVGFLFKIGIILVVIAAIYWLVASNFGLPLPV